MALDKLEILDAQNSAPTRDRHVTLTVMASDGLVPRDCMPPLFSEQVIN